MTLQGIYDHISQKITLLVQGDEIILRDFFTVPPTPKQGSIALPCFRFAKKQKQPPQQIARELAENIKKDKVIAKVEAAGPYLNIFVAPKIWNKAVLKGLSERHTAKNPKKIMIEYSSPNTHKEFHVGHLRNTLLGAAIVNIVRELGHTVIPVNYINDTGAHVAKCLWALEKFYKNEEPQENLGEFLGKVYVDATQKSDDDEHAQKEISEVLQKLEAKDPALYKLWKKTRQWSLDQFEQIYKELNVQFEYTFYDSELLDEGKKIAEEMLAQGIAKRDQGAVLIELSEYGLDVFLLIKSDGTALYQTKDLALAQKKYRDFDIDESWHVVDVRQTHYFRQLFKTLELNGFDRKLIHIPYEFVTLPDGAMSSRKGNVILYSDLMRDAASKAAEETIKRHSDWSSSKVQKVSRVVALAAIKLSMLKHENNQVITFELDNALSFNGDTGPYLLYTYARARSLLRKAGDEYQVAAKSIDFSRYSTPHEQELFALMAQHAIIVQKAADEQKPSLVATYLIQLAHLFNEFYHEVPVLQAEEQKDILARLFYIEQFSLHMRHMMNLLNIEVLDEM